MHKYIPTVTIEDIIFAMEENHRIVYKSAIKNAVKYATEKHKGVFRKSEEPYINHPLRVAYSIASWGLDSDAVVAAILHDVVEDCAGVTTETIANFFNLRVANLVDSVTSVDKAITDAENEERTKEYIDRVSDTKLIKCMNRTALLIKIADRLDNLSTIKCFRIEKQIKKARDTREILIPIAKVAGAYELIDDLESYCIKIEHRDRYQAIVKAYNGMLTQNETSINLFLNQFDSIVDAIRGLSNSSTSLQLLNKSKGSSLSNAIKGVEYKKRSVASLYRQAVSFSDVIPNSHSNDEVRTNESALLPFTSIGKDNTPSYDITLIINDNYVESREELDLNDLFFMFYDRFMLYNGVEICSVNFTTHGNSSFVLIKDEMGNLYRVFVRSEFDYLRYKLGDIIDGREEFNFTDIDEDDPKRTFNKKIKVYKRDGTAMYIDEGATVLDFAFAIHTDIGLHFKYAKIEGNPSELPAYTPLSNGDQVTIEHSAEIVPSITWFKYVKTNKATEKLIKEIAMLYHIPT